MPLKIKRKLQKRKVTPAKRKTGSGHKYVPTEEDRKKVQNLVFCGYGHRQIALAIGTSMITVERHFRKELNEGRDLVDMEIGHGIVQSARDGDKTMRIYVSKACMGWRETARVGVQIEDEKGKAVSPTGLFTINIPGVTDVPD